jgi:nicotinamide-nucleotide amidase
MIAKAVILSTGDELVTGKVIDTNSAAIADQLSLLGLEIAAILKIGDNREKLVWALRRGNELGELIIGTGGLGPTADDLTAEVIAEFLGCRLKRNEKVAGLLRRRFKSRGLPWTANNLKQALFPEKSKIIPNALGTAPGFRVSIGRGKTLVWLSGVPQEMVAMLKANVIPWIKKERREAPGISSCTFKIFGLTESNLDDILKPIPLTRHVALSFRAHYPDLSLRLTVRGYRGRESLFRRLKSRIRRLLGAHIYGEGDLTLEEIVGRLLLKKKLTLALAESCTGGYISHRITRVAGSSVYFKYAAVTYSNESKIDSLGVKPATLERYGAVSRETAVEMSQGIRVRAGTDIGLSVTGIAGPTGGSPNKPVGTVWISIAQPTKSAARMFRFQGQRERVIRGTSQAALHWLRTTLL